MEKTAKSVIIIGAGVGGLATAALLGKAGYKVTIVEKNEQVGGVAGAFSVSKHNGTWQADETLKSGKNSFHFDMGPSWYLMTDVFEHFFELMGEDITKHFKLVKLSPSYRVNYKGTFRKLDIISDLERDFPTVEQLEPGGGLALKQYLTRAAYNYDVAIQRFMYKNYDSWRDFMTPEMAREAVRLKVLRNLDGYAARFFQSQAARKLVLYPSLFLGSSPYRTPALYSLLSHADMTQGVHYPLGGMHQIVKALHKLALKHGAEVRLNEPVSGILLEDGKAIGVRLANGEALHADIVISNADRRHTEHDLLDAPHRDHDGKWWQQRMVGPSALIMYLGVKGELPALAHHNLLFSKDWRQNFDDLFAKPGKRLRWPKDASLYVCNPSKTDPSAAPKGHENLFVMVPIAAGLACRKGEVAGYAEKVLQILEQELRVPDLRQQIVYRRDFCVDDFASRYNSYRGSALGLSHSLRQTAAGRPSNASRKTGNLYYVGANTSPGIGLPSCLISAELLYKRLINNTSARPLPADHFASQP